MFLKSKSLHILNLFLSLKKYSILELENILKLKRRSILTNINIVNRFLQDKGLNGIRKEGGILYLDEKEVVKIKKLEMDICIDFNERKDYIILNLLLSNKIILNNISKELDITRRTLNHDIKKIKDYLKIYKLNLTSLPSKGIFLVGNESDIRELLSNYLIKFMIQKNEHHKLLINLIDKIFSKQEMIFVERIVLNLIKKINIEFPIEFFYKIVSVILIHRHREELFIGDDKTYVTSNKLIKDKNYEEVIKFLKSEELKILNLYELDSIAEVILFLLEDKNLNTIDDSTRVFLKMLEIKLNKDIPVNKMFLTKLSTIIKIAKFKVEFNFIKTKDVCKLSKNYLEYFSYVEYIIKRIIPEVQTEDIIYLTIFLKNELDNLRLNDDKYKKIIIIDNSFNNIYGDICLKYLERNYYVNVLNIIKSYNIKDILKLDLKIDLFLSLDFLENIDLQVPLINLNTETILGNIYDLEQHGFIKK